MSKPLRLFVEETPKKVFVSALDWPGLARGAKTEDLAVESLVAHLPRYAKVAHKAGERFDPHDFDIEVVSRTEGDAGSAYGIPSLVAPEDRDAGRCARGEADRIDRRGVVGRVRRRSRRRRRSRSGRAHAAAGATGRRSSSTSPGRTAATPARWASRATPRRRRASRPSGRRCWRCCGTTSDGSPIADKKWPPRYAARRVAWHALDHAWEIEDRTERD